MIRRIALGLGLLVLGTSFFTARFSAGEEPAKAVRLAVDYGDGVEKHFTALPFRAEMTVFDALELAQKHPRGIAFQHRGSGATAFVLQIDDLKNEGSGRNWVYRVNDKLADRSCALYRLEAGDAVLWKFEKSR